LQLLHAGTYQGEVQTTDLEIQMRHEIEDIIALIESQYQARPTPMEFEMAYQARVAIDRIRFAIKHTEQFAPHTDEMREAGLQLLDALERLQTVERRFQRRSLQAPTTEESVSKCAGHARSSEVPGKRSLSQPNGRGGNEARDAASGT
jgi:hypothetical protein